MVYNICQHFRTALPPSLHSPAPRGGPSQDAAASMYTTDAERANSRVNGAFQLTSFQGMMKL